ncbi:MAG TPA: RNA methyltransferase [Labilithrix sp.]|jgi:TrmH RNA methyltransferase
MKAEPSARGEREIVYGLRATLAVFAKRPDDILRVGYAREVRGEAAELVAWASKRRVPCDELTTRDLDRVADSSHHEGLVVMARRRAWTTSKALGDLLAQKKGSAIALDRVRNPYNVGAIVRTAAFFGVDALLVASELAPQAVRVAEGGAEHMALARTTDLVDTLARLRQRGVRVVGADVRGSADAGELRERPVVLVLGHEREGVADRVRAQCDALVRIEGTGAVESLNVGVAAGILIASMTR